MGQEADGCKILIVEDNDGDLFLLRQRLDQILPHCRTLCVKTVGDAYTAYKSCAIDLILLDLNLPDGYGPGTVSQVRQFFKSTPIIVVTGYGTDMSVCECLKLGANNVISKSQISDHDFVNIIEQNVT